MHGNFDEVFYVLTIGFVLGTIFTFISISIFRYVVYLIRGK